MIARKNVRLKGSQTKQYFENKLSRPKRKRHIEDLHPGQYGYCVPWAYNPQTDYLDDSFDLHSSSFGTACMLVRCVSWGLYEIEILE